jgi:hypothetical protein
MRLLMTAEEVQLFGSFLRCAGSYLEFGAGGSTVLAATLVRGPIVSVDSSRDWLGKVERACAEMPDCSPLLLHYVDIGKTGAFGFPADNSRRAAWVDYHTTAWALPDAGRTEFCLVDGRFRVACFAQAMLHCGAETLVAIHDFAERPKYHVVRDIGTEIARAANLSIFRRRSDFDRARAEALVAEYAFETS